MLGRYLGPRTPYQIVNFERSNEQSNDFIIFVKHTRMVIDVDGGSQNSNARILQFPHKKNHFTQTNQRFRLHRVIDHRMQQEMHNIPAEFFR